MAGILNYNNFLNTLQTVTSVGNIFPNEKKTLTFTIEGGGTQGWTAEIAWSTILVDKIERDRDDKPVFTKSSITGYFPDNDGTLSQYSTGTITVPAFLYTGPILPASDNNVPISIVNIKWAKEGQEFSTNIAYIQNWEPGVALGNPYNWVGFEPVDPVSSTLELNGTSVAIYSDDIFLTAISDIPIDLGTDNECSFYATSSTGSAYLIGTALFVEKAASVVIDTDGLMPVDTYTVYAEFRGKAQYGKTRSANKTIQIVSGIPLIKSSDSFVPSRAIYYPGDSSLYSITLIPDPSFPPTGVAVANTVTLSLINEFIPFTSTTFLSGNLVNGATSGTFTVNASMIDSTIAHTGTNWTIQSFSTATGQYVTQVLITNDETVKTSWGYQTVGRYAAGSTSTLITVGNTLTRTLSINPFNLTLSKSPDSTAFGENLTVLIGTTNTTYSKNITVTATKDSESVIIYQANNSGFESTSTVSSILSTGTWTIIATYPGDFGDSIYFANAPSHSNSLSHRVRAGNELTPEPVLSFYTTATNDVLRVWASTSTTLTNTVSFFNGSTLLGTANWIRRAENETTQTVWYQGGSINPGMPSIMFRGDNLNPLDRSGNFAGAGPANSPAGNLTTVTNDVRFAAPQFNFNTNSEIPGTTPTWEKDIPEITDDSYLYIPGFAKTKGKVAAQRYGIVNPNRWRLWKYYDGTNYDMSAGTATDITTLLDPITTGTWTVTKRESYTGNLMYNERNQTNLEFTGGLPRDTNYQYDVYDIYRTDDIGDYRGYNVIGIEVDETLGRPEVSEENPYRMYFRPSTRVRNANGSFSGSDLPVEERYGISPGYIRSYSGPQFPGANFAYRSTSTGVYGTTQHIDLVEFIGEVHWLRPLQSNLEPREFIKVWLFKFTPEVRQTNTSFQTYRPFKEQLDQLPANEYRPDGGYKNVPVSTTGIYKLKDGRYREFGYTDWRGEEYNRDTYYGFKEWTPRNNVDIVEKEYTDFCNSWYLSFALHSYDPRGSQYSNIPGSNAVYSTASIGTVYTTTSIVAYNIQTAELVLPPGTISSITNIHATWPGTIGLGPEYGRFIGFDIYAQQPEIDIVTTATFISPPSFIEGQLVSTSTITVSATRGRSSNGVIYSTNPARLTADLSVDLVKFPGATSNLNSGTITFFNGLTGAEFGTTSVVDNQANLSITSNTLTNSNSALIDVRARYNRTGYQHSTSTTMPLQVINYNSYTMTNVDFLMGFPDPNLGSVNATMIAGYQLPQKELTILTTLTKASTGYTDGLVKIVGSFNLILPSLAGANRPWTRRSNSEDLTSTQRYNEYGPLAIELYYYVDNIVNPFSWVPLPLTNPSNISLTSNPPLFLHTNRYEIQRQNNVVNTPIAVTLNINATDLWKTYVNYSSSDPKLTYDQEWATIYIAYRLIGGDGSNQITSNLAALAYGTRFGYQQNISLSR